MHLTASAFQMSARCEAGAVPFKRPRGRGAQAADESFPELDGHSPAIERLKRHRQRGARCVVSALMRGIWNRKERAAGDSSLLHGQAIHSTSNCAGLTRPWPRTSSSATRGAFTGAVADRPAFERANGGTVFLDEIGEMAADSQVKLLRALQQRTVQRLGSSQETPFDVRVIAATNADLESAQQRGRFRQDLYYRLKVFELRVPPLRRRGESDLRQLAGAILQHLSARRRRSPAALSAGVWDTFARSSWRAMRPGSSNTFDAIVAAGTTCCRRHTCLTTCGKSPRRLERRCRTWERFRRKRRGPHPRKRGRSFNVTISNTGGLPSHWAYPGISCIGCSNVGRARSRPAAVRRLDPFGGSRLRRASAQRWCERRAARVPGADCRGRRTPIRIGEHQPRLRPRAQPGEAAVVVVSRIRTRRGARRHHKLTSSRQAGSGRAAAGQLRRPRQIQPTALSPVNALDARSVASTPSAARR